MVHLPAPNAPKPVLSGGPAKDSGSLCGNHQQLATSLKTGACLSYHVDPPRRSKIFLHFKCKRNVVIFVSLTASSGWPPVATIECSLKSPMWAVSSGPKTKKAPPQPNTFIALSSLRPDMSQHTGQCEMRVRCLRPRECGSAERSAALEERARVAPRSDSRGRTWNFSSIC